MGTSKNQQETRIETLEEAIRNKKREARNEKQKEIIGTKKQETRNNETRKKNQEPLRSNTKL